MRGKRQKARGKSGLLDVAGRLRPFALALLLLPLAFCLLPSAAAQAPVEMGATADRDSVTVGDRIKVTVTLTLPADAQANLQELETQFGDLDLLLVGLPQDTLLADGRRQVTAVYEVAAFHVGAAQVPALSLPVRLADGTLQQASSNPLPIAVRSVIPDGENPTEVKDLKPQVSFPLAGDTLRGVVFADAGTVEEEFEINTVRTSIGAGFRLIVPILGPAPVAVDFAWPLNKDDEDETQVISFSFGVSP